MADVPLHETLEVVVVDGTTNNGAEMIVDTRGAALVRQAGEYATDQGNMYATTLLKTVATAGTNIALFRNPSGSGKTLTIHNITVAPISNSEDSVSLRFYESPTIAADGTELTYVNTHFGSANVNVADVFDGPTHSALGTLFWVTVYNKNTPPVTLVNGKIKLDANEQLLLRGIAEGIVSVSVRLTVFWSEA